MALWSQECGCIVCELRRIAASEPDEHEMFKCDKDDCNEQAQYIVSARYTYLVQYNKLACASHVEYFKEQHVTNLIKDLDVTRDGIFLMVQELEI